MWELYLTNTICLCEKKIYPRIRNKDTKCRYGDEHGNVRSQSKKFVFKQVIFEKSTAWLICFPSYHHKVNS